MAPPSVVATVPMEFLLPHVVMANLWAQDNDGFRTTILPEGYGPRAFWSEVQRRGDPRLDGHPMLARAGWQDNAIPISIHGDAVPVTGIGGHHTKSLDCISWQSLFAQGGTIRQIKNY
eukprot:3521845-Pyramimonas_sp.AAC.1